MSLVVGARVQQLLDQHGDSYATAGDRTKVNRETLRRICLGYSSPKLRKYIRQIAEAYGIDELALLEGGSPKAEFEWYVRQAPPSQRLEWLLMTPAQRVKMALNFLQVKYPSSVTLPVLASAWGKTQAETYALLETWRISPPDRKTALILAEAIHGLSDIPISWFTKGRLADVWTEPAGYLPKLASFVRMNAKLGASTSEGLTAIMRAVGLI